MQFGFGGVETEKSVFQGAYGRLRYADQTLATFIPIHNVMCCHGAARVKVVVA